MLRRILLLCLSLLPALCLPAASARKLIAPTSARPNLIVIIADDLGADDVGAFGGRSVRTPNLDRLAKEGMRFSRAFVTASSCSPSRASILTGRFPHATDAEQLHWPLPAAQATFVEKLREAGYWTAAAGKWHLGEDAKSRFDLVKEADPRGFQLPGGTTNAPAAAMTAQDNQSGCAEWLDTLRARPEGRPFFLWLAAFDPHRDYQTNAIARPHFQHDMEVPPYWPNIAAVRGDLALYCDEVARLDGFVGGVLNELDRAGLAESTCVVFLSDNGRPFPREKTTLYDSGIRTPLMVRWPAAVKAGVVCTNLVSTVDLAPMFMEFAGLPPLPGFQGVSLTPLLKNPAKPVQSHIFAERNWHDFEACQRAVRSARFKYIHNYLPELPDTPPADALRSPTFAALQRYRGHAAMSAAQQHCFIQPRPAEELYDTMEDPHELKNLADNPAFAPVLREMRELLARWRETTGDQPLAFRTPDEFDRNTGQPLPNRKRPRASKAEMLRQIQAPAEAADPAAKPKE